MEIDWLLVGVIGIVVLSFVLAKWYADKYGHNRGEEFEAQRHLVRQVLGYTSPYEEYKPKKKEPTAAAVTEGNAVTDAGTNRPRRGRKED